MDRRRHRPSWSRTHDAPDIVSVVVRRGDVIVAPIKNTLDRCNFLMGTARRRRFIPGW